MAATVEHLLTEIRALYGFTQSDEISLLFPRERDLFNRKLRKLNSVLAGTASAKFSLGLGDLGCFACRICELRGTKQVVDYFRWRSEDAHRNALNAPCYWLVRRQGADATPATNRLRALSVAGKNEMLFQNGINFNDLPARKKRGIGVYWEEYQKEGLNPLTRQKVLARRSRAKRDLELPMKEAYSAFVAKFCSDD